MFNFVINKEQVIQALGIENSAPAFQDQVINKLYDRLSERMWSRVQPELTEEEVKDLDKVATQGGDNAAKAWFDQRFPNNEAMYQEELADLVAELRASMDAVASMRKQSPQQ